MSQQSFTMYMLHGMVVLGDVWSLIIYLLHCLVVLGYVWSILSAIW